MAREQVANGLRPLADGFDWLKENGFRAVLHVHAPGEDDAADRELVERRGMVFRSVEVSPQTLNKAAVDSFSSIVTDKAQAPIFVYDKDGTLAGGLWYLQFRIADHMSDAEARQKARQLGLKEDGDSKMMWLAIQKYLNEQPR